MAHKYSTDEWHKLLEKSDKYEISEENTRDNVEEQIQITDELISGIQTYFKPRTFYTIQTHPISATRKCAHNFANASDGLMNTRLILYFQIYLLNFSLHITPVLEAFQLFITDRVLSYIIGYTNIRGTA